MMPTLIELRTAEYELVQEARGLRRLVFEHGDVDAMTELAQIEMQLEQISAARAKKETETNADHAAIAVAADDGDLLGIDSTGVEVTITLRMSQVLTSIVHLLDRATHPLVQFDIRNASQKLKRFRVISYVEGYSAQAIETIELDVNEKETVLQLPTFFPDALRAVTEVTRATLNVQVEDLDAKTEIHRTAPIWLLARSTAPLQVKDAGTGKLIDMTRYLGAYVTPNAPKVMEFLRKAVEKHPQRRFVGYQGKTEDAIKVDVEAQVAAIYKTLSEEGVVYVNSVIDFTPDPAWNNQRVRRPEETLTTRQGNCIDGTVAMASLLEAISLTPAIVIIPGHAFLAWRPLRNKGDWRFVETTMIATHAFDGACAAAEETAARQRLENAAQLRIYSLSNLRVGGITPLE